MKCSTVCPDGECPSCPIIECPPNYWSRCYYIKYKSKNSGNIMKTGECSREDYCAHYDKVYPELYASQVFEVKYICHSLDMNINPLPLKAPPNNCVGIFDPTMVRF